MCNIHRKNLFLLSSSFIFVLLFTLIQPNVSHATDNKIYPAFMCLENGTETKDFNRSMYRITRVKNNGSGILLCPIIRDTIQDNSGAGKKQNLVQVKVHTYRTDPAPKIRLTFRKFNHKGNLIQEDTKFPLGGDQSTLLSLKFRKDDGYYMLEVEMGVNKPQEYAKLFSYKMFE